MALCCDRAALSAAFSASQLVLIEVIEARSVMTPSKSPSLNTWGWRRNNFVVMRETTVSKSKRPSSFPS